MCVRFQLVECSDANVCFILKAHDGAYLPELAVNWTEALLTIGRPTNPGGRSARSQIEG